ncbi:SNF2 family N-terminal domain-containing protein [Sordaria brevicollis]|uniref:SNF2 family N-terminal domain-containing protein n=1 Tax=Sordaria brevicollis TaxID=83679 RepID=A0AAE0PLM7_SORBR|nr:SNF2 family N-terminal domain-containing protein [Sordaria brevicollis]
MARNKRSDSFVDDSFSDEDLDFINSQVTEEEEEEDDSISMSSSQQQDLSFASGRGSASNNGTPKNKNHNNVVDLTASSPAVHGHASTPIPKFGQPTQLVSQFTPVNNNTSNTKNAAASRSGGGTDTKNVLNPSPHGSGPLGPKGRVGASSHAIGGSKYNNLFNDRGKNRPEFHRDLYRSSGPLKANGPSGKQQQDGIKRNSAGMQLFSSLEADREAAAQAAAAAAAAGTKPSPLTPGRGTASKGTAAAFGENVFYTDPDKAKEDLKALLEGGLEEEEEESEGEETKEKVKKGEAKSESKKKEESIVSSTGHLPGLAVPLLPHQVEGVRWMINRELGPLKRGRVPKGGLLADDMGLGKTLQSISLIIGNRKPASSSAPGWKAHFKDISKATLVVAPLALIRQWEAELKDRVMPDLNIKVCVHHGPKRSTDPSELAKYDVVITTYQILVSEHDKSHPDPNKGAQAGCFGVHWFRVILDEAHSIKNRNTKAAKACCALRSEYRWCLTGTPMQNNLDELQSLIHFLRIAPYDNLAEWRAQIDAPMKQGKGHIAIQRLHSILRCFMKRRTKEVLTEKGALVAGGKEALAKAEEKGEKAPEAAFKVTERKVVTIETEFSPAENAFYKALEERADQSLEKMMKGRTVNYANALVLLLRLRQACNHPRLAQTKLDKDRDALAVDSATAPTPGGKRGKAAYDSQSQTSSVDDLADMMGGMGIQTRQCDMCLGEMTKKEIQEGQLRCQGCEESLNQLMKEQQSTQESVSSKKHKKKKVSVVKEKVKVERKTRGRGRKVVVDSDDEAEEEDEDEDTTPKKAKKSRDNRKRIVDSDDEEEEGSWLVGESQRSDLNLGVAGGTDDENAEGTGEDIDTNEEISEDSEDPEQDSFVVKDSDEDDDDDDESVDSDEIVGSGDEDDTIASVSKLSSKVLKQCETEESETAASSEEESDISESELDDSSETDSEAEYGVKRTKAPLTISAKIHELIGILRREAPQHKFIVFSQFTSMLDLVEPFLHHHLPDIKHVRYDGKMPNDARERSLHSLRNDPRTRVLLCSLKCGSLGLNLTAATRVIIVEPFWNPFVEEQAIDRVHRLTQTVDVVVYKLTVRGTVEARILELQEKKRLLAQTAVEGSTERGKKKGQGLKLGLQEILELFKHDGSANAHYVPENGAQNEFYAPPAGRTPARRAPANTGARREHEVFGRRW